MENLFSAERLFGDQLDAAGVQSIYDAIDRANWRRIRIFFGFTMVFELLLIAMVDLPAIAAARSGSVLAGPDASVGPGEGLALPLAFLLCHLGIFLSSAVGIFAAFRALSRPQRSPDAARKLLATPTLAPSILPAIVLMLLGVIAGLDQLRSGDIGAFTINMVVASILVYVRPPLGFLVFTPGFAFMIGGVILLQSDASLRLAHFVNGGIFYIAVLLLSAFLYNNQFSQSAKSILIERATARIEELALHDELTGLANRRAFLAIFEREHSRMKREGRRDFLAVGDIDYFKNLNDQYGHPAGDAALVAVAKILDASTRATDAVARWGGEEFIFLLGGCTVETAREILERTRRSIEAIRIEHGGRPIGCTLSFGFTEIDAAEANDFDGAYRRADEALYSAKLGGRNRVAGPDAT
jgi:diguanylate cyclase (GGDEF)-like protein